MRYAFVSSKIVDDLDCVCVCVCVCFFFLALRRTLLARTLFSQDDLRRIFNSKRLVDGEDFITFGEFYNIISLQEDVILHRHSVLTVTPAFLCCQLSP